jgi:hypothetical protein
MRVKNKWERAWEEAVVAYFKLLPEGTVRNHSKLKTVEMLA